MMVKNSFFPQRVILLNDLPTVGQLFAAHPAAGYSNELSTMGRATIGPNRVGYVKIDHHSALLLMIMIIIVVFYMFTGCMGPGFATIGRIHSNARLRRTDLLPYAKTVTDNHHLVVLKQIRTAEGFSP